MPSFTRPGSSVIDYNAVTGDSVTTAAQKQDIALNDLYANIVDGTAAAKGIVQLGTTASTAALGNHLHTGIYQPAGSYAASGANSDITSLSGLTTPLSVAQGGTGGTTASGARSELGLGSASLANTGTGPGNVPVLDSGGKLAGSTIPDDVAGLDLTARDLAIRNAIKASILAAESSLSIPGGYLRLFASDELATKTGAVYDATNKRYSNQAANPSYANPGGTGNRTSSITCALPPQITDGVASNLVDGTTTTQAGMWFTSQPNASSCFQFNFGASAAKVISEFKLYQSSAAAQGVWKWQGMVDGGSSYEDIVGSINVGDAGNATSTHAIGATYTKGYRYFRLAYVSGTINGTPNWNEFEFKIDDYSASAATLVPAAITAGAVPNTVDIYLVHKAVDTVSLGTDLKVRASRDNGSHWSGYGDLSTLCSFDATYNLLKCTVDLSALPAGTSVKWEITAPTGKSQLWRAVAELLR